MIKIVPRDPLPPGVKPCPDSLHLGSNVVITIANRIGEHCHYMIVINTATGERVRIDFDNELPDEELPDEELPDNELTEGDSHDDD